MAEHILQFFSTLNNGGAENRMMDVYRCIDPDVVQFDFAVVHDGEHFFDREVLAGGSGKYVLPDPRTGLLKNYRALVRFFREHPFRAVHTHVSWYSGIVLMAAKQAGVKIRIAHARTAAIPNQSLAKRVVRRLGQFLIACSATHRFAISEEAAEFIFGSRAVKRGAYQYVPNAIDQKKYVFLEGDARDALRRQLGIPDGRKAYVTVANFRKAKNHTFLLDVAKVLKERDDAFVLFLIGDGDLRPDIEQKIAQLGLENHVRLLGSRRDVPGILTAFDAMIFPSIYEGLGGVVLEAQLTGVHAIVSDAIPSVADLGIGMVDFLPLDDPSRWADTIIARTAHPRRDHRAALQALSDKGYCIEQTTCKYLKAYGLSDDAIRRAVTRNTVNGTENYHE